MKRSPLLIACAIVAAISITATAGAASKYLITSTKQIKPSVRHALKGQRGDEGPQGDAGFRGIPGPAGAAGPAGAQGPAGIANITIVNSPESSVAPGGSAAPVATCPAGAKVVGTGFYNSITKIGFVSAYGSFVGGIFFNDSGIVVDHIRVQAICAQPGGASAASVRTASNKERFVQDVERAKAAQG